jgi:histidinol phosphatase-like enzyme
MPYRVTAPLVVAKDQNGQGRHYYHGAILHYLNDVQRKHFLSKGLVQEIVEHKPEAPVAEVAHAATVTGKPAKAGTHEAWVSYAVSQGLSEAEAKSKSKQELIDALG